MKLVELEKELGVAFPKRFHEIYETGAMKWLELNKDKFKNNRDNYINDEKAFLMLNCGCELYPFDEIPKAIETLQEWIKWQEEDEKVVLADGIILIPFGHSGRGDMYCFLYSSETEEPQIVIYCRDAYGEPEIIGYDFDEFIYVQLLEAVDNEEEIDGGHFQENIQYLNAKYRQLILRKNVDTLIEEYINLAVDKAKIWVKI